MFLNAKRKEEIIISSWRINNSKLFREILSIIRRCDGEYGDILEDEGAELIMKKIEKLIQLKGGEIDENRL